ncbi:MAG: pirin family protein [Nocardioidaceae bacterium]
MSNLEREPEESVCASAPAEVPVLDLLPGRLVPLSVRRPLEKGPDGLEHARDETIVNRMLPQRSRRMVGAWCFVDHYGPDDISGTSGMQVAPHPHSGLQTVSWLYDGAVLHQDCLGSRQLVRPGGLGLMTAGHAISHSEASPERRAGGGTASATTGTADRPDLLHGMQLWVALPDDARATAPGWEYHAELPRGSFGTAEVRVLLGTVGEVTSPATTYTPIVGAEVRLTGEATLPMRAGFEYAIVVASGSVAVDDSAIEPGSLAYLGCGRDQLAVSSTEGATFLLLGGEPFEEEIVMWWNFIGRSHDEILAMRKAWMEGSDYGTVDSFGGETIPAPPLPEVSLRPRGRAG